MYVEDPVTIELFCLLIYCRDTTAKLMHILLVISCQSFWQTASDSKIIGANRPGKCALIIDMVIINLIIDKVIINFSPTF